ITDSDGNGILRKKNKTPAPATEKSAETPDIPPEENIYDYEAYFDYEDYYYNSDIDIPVVEDFEEYEQERLHEQTEESEEKTHNVNDEKSESKTHSEDDEEETEKENKKSITDKIEFLINIWEIAGSPLLKIFRGFHIKKLYIDFVVAGDDAFQCAVLYGTVSGMVYNLLAWLGELFTVSYKTVDINCGFDKHKSKWDVSCKISFRLYTFLFSALWFITVYLFRIYIPEKNGRKKSGK
ncbi:MAG: hypothetical protein K2G36_10365, partial [Ruminococcus sp.]|nr:hypothetical protein [Ruminococcus sp.]